MNHKVDDKPLSIREAALAMLNGEILVNREGIEQSFDDSRGFMCGGINGSTTRWLDNLYRRPAKRKRIMTKNEAFVWAESEASLGWMVCNIADNKWTFPRFFSYRMCCIENYQRARLLPDLSGIDESTVQGFEIEVKE
jgi:hypothetical protein